MPVLASPSWELDMSIHRLTLDAAVTEFLRTHRDGARMLLEYMSSVPSDPVQAAQVPPNSLTGRCLEQFHRLRATAVKKVMP